MAAAVAFDETAFLIAPSRIILSLGRNVTHVREGGSSSDFFVYTEPRRAAVKVIVGESWTALWQLSNYP